MRGFIAINLPADVRVSLDGVLAPVRRGTSGVRWVAADALHITLQFLGWLDDARVPVLCAAIEAALAGAEPFTLALDGFGAFPDMRRPRVLWVGADAAPALLDVQRSVERALEPVGFVPEARAFHPHVTIGRAERDARSADVAAAAAAARARSFDATVAVHSVELMESRLQRSGARYSVVRSFALRGST